MRSTIKWSRVCIMVAWVLGIFVTIEAVRVAVANLFCGGRNGGDDSGSKKRKRSYSSVGGDSGYFSDEEGANMRLL